MTASTSTMKALPALRRAVARAIEFDHRVISLVPDSNTLLAKPGGIYDHNQPPNTSGLPARAPQKFSLSAYNIYGYNTIADIGGENDFRRYYQMSGKWDAVVEIGDWWIDGDTTYRVVSVLPKNDYEVRCLVIAFGKDPNYG